MGNITDRRGPNAGQKPEIELRTRYAGAPLKFEQSTIIDRQFDQLDVGTWLFSMNDEDYQKAAGGHRALGTFADGTTRGMVNVEAIGGHLMVQHYKEVASSRSEVVMVSPKSRIYLAHLIPTLMGVRWTMSVKGLDAARSSFTCRVELFLPRWLRRLGPLLGVSHFVQAHVDEETIGYARDLMSR
jgi:hypothetical protein